MYLDNTTVKIKAFIIGDGESRAAIEQMANDLGIKYTQTYRCNASTSIDLYIVENRY